MGEKTRSTGWDWLGKEKLRAKGKPEVEKKGYTEQEKKSQKQGQKV